MGIVLLLVASTALALAPSAGAHRFTKAEGNDRPGKLDLKAVSVRHTATAVVHSVRTFAKWTPRSLGDDSFFIIQIDKQNDREYERCAFIYFAGGKLRGHLTNCGGGRFLRFLQVGKPNGTTAKIVIPKGQTGAVYWWSGVSVWDGPAPCASRCVDFAPNRFPDILHDLKPPVVRISGDEVINNWDVSTSTSLAFPFTVSDQHAGIGSWTIQKRSRESGANGPWTDVLSGAASGALDPSIMTTGGRFVYRVVVVDEHGNRAISGPRWIDEAIDVDEVTGPGTFDPAATPVADGTAFGGDRVPLDDAGDAFEWAFISPSAGIGRDLKVIGPGDGTWLVEVFIDGTSTGTLSAADISDGPRQVLLTFDGSDDVTLRLELVSGGGFGIDALLA